MNKTVEMRFDGYMDIESIRRRIIVRPEPVEGLELFQSLVAAEQLAEKLREMYLPNEFSLNFIQEINVGATSILVTKTPQVSD